MSGFVLINCPPWGVVMPPLGVAYLATYLKSCGKKVEVRDLNLKLYEKALPDQKKFWDLDTINRLPTLEIARGLFRGFGPEISEFIESLADYKVIGMSANNLISVTFAGMLAEAIKKRWKDRIIILGGPGAYHSWDRSSAGDNAVDYFVIGEGEEVLAKFLDAVDSGAELSELPGKIPGLFSANTRSAQKFLPAVNIKSLDKIPFPTFEEFDLSAYNRGQKYRPLPMLISRGCINQCSYCIDWYMCHPFRSRNPESVVLEMRHHVQNYGITHLEFNDLLCNGNLLQLEEIVDKMTASGMKLNWISYAAIRKNMSAELLNKMKNAGCQNLCYGIESGSDPILQRMNKHYSRADAADLVRKTHAAGIQVSINIIVGFPGETEHDFQQTLEFIRENSAYIYQVTNVSSFVLMPGADAAIFPHQFGVTFADPLDPGLWQDENGLSQEERNQRVRRVCRLLEELKIKNLIINYPETKNSRPSLVMKKTEPSAEIVPETPQAKKFVRKKIALKIPVLVFLAVLSLCGDLYLYLIKKIRGSVIFPGS